MTGDLVAAGSSGDPTLRASRVKGLARFQQLVLIAVAYYLGARLGLSLSLVESNVTPLWPPTGIAVAAFLILGRSLWPAVAVAAFAVNLPISHGVVAALATGAFHVFPDSMARKFWAAYQGFAKAVVEGDTREG